MEHIGRRAAMKKGAVGAAAAGVTWAAPRVDGLSLRPDYARAQTAVVPDTTIDVAGIPSASSVFSSVSGAALPSMLDFIGISITPGSFNALILGSGAAANCFINAANVTSNAGGGWTPPLASPPFMAATVSASSGWWRDGGTSGGGTRTIHLEISCS